MKRFGLLCHGGLARENREEKESTLLVCKEKRSGKKKIEE